MPKKVSLPAKGINIIPTKNIFAPKYKDMLSQQLDRPRINGLICNQYLHGKWENDQCYKIPKRSSSKIDLISFSNRNHRITPTIFVNPTPKNMPKVEPWDWFPIDASSLVRLVKNNQWNSTNRRLADVTINEIKQWANDPQSIKFPSGSWIFHRKGSKITL